MLLKSLPYEKLWSEISVARMLPEKLRRKTFGKNMRTKMLLKNLPHETYRQKYA